MNEVIKKLIKSLGIIPEDEHYDIAELIIKECAKIDSEMNNPDHIDGLSMNETILEHFGIDRYSGSKYR